MISTSNRLAIFSLIGLFLTTSAWAGDPYKKALKKWTRHARSYDWNNLEARLDWDATYQSEAFREARVVKLAHLLEKTADEVAADQMKEEQEAARYDDFFIGVYAGSAQWSPVGKNAMEWSLVLEAEDLEPVRPLRIERIILGQREKILYPYLDRWDQGLWVRFPKVVQPGKRFVLRMTGLPARSELVWK